MRSIHLVCEQFLRNFNAAMAILRKSSALGSPAAHGGGVLPAAYLGTAVGYMPARQSAIGTDLDRPRQAGFQTAVVSHCLTCYMSYQKNAATLDPAPTSHAYISTVFALTCLQYFYPLP